MHRINIEEVKKPKTKKIPTSCNLNTSIVLLLTVFQFILLLVLCEDTSFT